VCDSCRAELILADSLRPTTTQRIIAALISLRNTLLAIAVILALIVGGYLLLKDRIAVQLTPEELARFRYAVAGSFNTPEGINASTTVLGAAIVSATSERPGHDTKRVIDEYGGADYAGWRSQDATFPQEIVVKLADNGGVDKVIITNQPIESPDTYVREFEVLLSAEGADGPWPLAGRWSAEQKVWHTRVGESKALQAEFDWLKENAYHQRSAVVQFEKLEAAVRYSSRAGELLYHQL
jgi:hypothetical protein